MHGAGLTHLLFLPDWAAVFELYNFFLYQISFDDVLFIYSIFPLFSTDTTVVMNIVIRTWLACGVLHMKLGVPRQK